MQTYEESLDVLERELAGVQGTFASLTDQDWQ